MRFTVPGYAPIRWLSVLWAIIGVLAFVVAARAGHTRGAVTGFAETACAVGIWFRIRSCGFLLLLLFAYSPVTKVAHVIHGDYPPIQLAIAALHVAFVGVLGVWLYREWTTGRVHKTEPNQPPQRNAGSRPSSDDSATSEAPSSLRPRG